MLATVIHDGSIHKLTVGQEEDIGTFILHLHRYILWRYAPGTLKISVNGNDLFSYNMNDLLEDVVHNESFIAYVTNQDPLYERNALDSIRSYAQVYEPDMVDRIPDPPYGSYDHEVDELFNDPSFFRSIAYTDPGEIDETFFE